MVPPVADDAVGLRDRQRHGEIPHQAAQPSRMPMQVPPCVVDPPHHGADDRVQTRTIPATGQQTDIHEPSPTGRARGPTTNRDPPVSVLALAAKSRSIRLD